MHGIKSICIIYIICLVCISCKTKYIPVTQTQVHYQSLHDTIITHDTVTNTSTTIIREVDSAYMAAYGVSIKGSQQAWLVSNAQQQGHTSISKITIRDTIRDTIPVPYYINSTSDAGMPLWQEILAIIGGISIVILPIYFLFASAKKDTSTSHDADVL